MKDAFLTELASGIRSKLPAAGVDKAQRPNELRDFLEQDIATETGAWSLEGHEAFGGIIELLSRVVRKKETDTSIAILAGEQTGKTLMAIGAAIHFTADHSRNVGYFFPTDKFAHKFGRTRLKRIISRSPYLTARMRDKDTVNQASLKEFDGSFLYLLGLESMLGAISIPLDILVYDEVDLIPAENMEWSAGRVAHSELRTSVFVSAGYVPGSGIDLRYQDGTQHRYLLDCANRRCRQRAICLEDTFPDCMAQVRGRWERVCPSCKTPLDLAAGKWVPLHPERIKQKKYSFRLPALVVGARAADHIMRRWERAKRKKSELAKFRCAELAKPDAGAMQPVTDAELQQMQRPELSLRLAQGMSPRYAGMDTGDLCHFWCHEVVGGRRHLVWAEEIDSDVAVERVSTLIGALGVRSLVIDKKPLTTLARALAYRFPQIVALQDFRDSSEIEVVEETHAPGQTGLDGPKYRCVKAPRDESLEDFTSEITDATTGLLMPELESAEVLSTLAAHLKALQKEADVDAKGRVVHRFLKGVANHFGMAGNSARLAELVAPNYLPFEYLREENPLNEARRTRGFRGAWT